MSGCYVSPIPAEIRVNYAHRDDDGNPVTERVHLWPSADGGVTPCNPVCCRECGRELAWHDHGEAA